MIDMEVVNFLLDDCFGIEDLTMHLSHFFNVLQVTIHYYYYYYCYYYYFFFLIISL